MNWSNLVNLMSFLVSAKNEFYFMKNEVMGLTPTMAAVAFLDALDVFARRGPASVSSFSFSSLSPSAVAVSPRACIQVDTLLFSVSHPNLCQPRDERKLILAADVCKGH